MARSEQDGPRRMGTAQGTLPFLIDPGVGVLASLRGATFYKIAFDKRKNVDIFLKKNFYRLWSTDCAGREIA